MISSPIGFLVRLISSIFSSIIPYFTVKTLLTTLSQNLLAHYSTYLGIEQAR